MAKRCPAIECWAGLEVRHWRTENGFRALWEVETVHGNFNFFFLGLPRTLKKELNSTQQYEQNCTLRIGWARIGQSWHESGNK